MYPWLIAPHTSNGMAGMISLAASRWYCVKYTSSPLMPAQLVYARPKILPCPPIRDIAVSKEMRILVEDCRKIMPRVLSFISGE